MKGAHVTTPTPDEQQPRVPGVNYREEQRFRAETTVIDGVASTRQVPYEVLVPVPPRDWEAFILRGVTGSTIGVTVIAVVGTTASVGGLLTELVHPVVAYGMGVVFTSSWLACLGIEWLNRLAPDRAKHARIAGWLALALSMAAVFCYGYNLRQPYAGGAGACIDLLAKGLWALLLNHHAVRLDDGVAHWVTDQEQKLAGRELLRSRLAQLNRRQAYQQAVGGPEYRAADAILTASAPAVISPAQPVSAPHGQPSGQPVPLVSGHGPAASTAPPQAPTGQPVPPVPPVSGQPVPPVSGQGSMASAAPPQAPAGQPVPPVSGQSPAPTAAPYQAPAGQSVPPVSGQPVPPVPGQGPVPAPVAQIGGGRIAVTIRQLLADHPEWELEKHLPLLIDAVKQVHGDGPCLHDTVRRTRDRQKNHKRKTA